MGLAEEVLGSVSSSVTTVARDWNDKLLVSSVIREDSFETVGQAHELLVVANSAFENGWFDLDLIEIFGVCVPGGIGGIDGVVDSRFHLSIDPIAQERSSLDHSAQISLHLVLVNRKWASLSLASLLLFLTVKRLVWGSHAGSSCLESILFNGVAGTDEHLLFVVLKGFVDVCGIIVVVLLWRYFFVVR